MSEPLGLIGVAQAMPLRDQQLSPDLLRALQCHDVLLLGAEQRPDGQACDPESRQLALEAHMQAWGGAVWRMRSGNPVVDDGQFGAVKDQFFLTDPEGHQVPAHWFDLAALLADKLAGRRVLADLTTLSGSSLLQLHAAAMQRRAFDLSYLYLTPVHYPQTADPVGNSPVVTRTIKQPHGYRSFGQEHGESGQRRHFIILGFDRHRPNKFIEHYQWPDDELQLLICRPAYVDGGELQAQLSVGRDLYDQLKSKGQVHQVNPMNVVGTLDDPGVADTLMRLSEGIDFVDVVPLGPKPTLLATAVFWHMLPEARRERTRLLYDFPVVRQARSEGVQQAWLFERMVAALAPERRAASR